MSLIKYRQEIQSIDRTIISLLKKRFIIIKKVSKIKKDKGLNVYHPGYEEKLLKKYSDFFGKEDIKKFVRSVFSGIFKASRDAQNDSIR